MSKFTFRIGDNGSINNPDMAWMFGKPHRDIVWRDRTVLGLVMSTSQQKDNHFNEEV